MTIKDKLQELSEEELVDFVSEAARQLKQAYKRVLKSAEAEINEDSYASRAKRTTLVARSWNNREQFNVHVEHLFEAVKRLR